MDGGSGLNIMYIRTLDEMGVDRTCLHLARAPFHGIMPRKQAMPLGIFNRLNKFGARWVTELPAVLWSLRTTPGRATGYTPFFMVYGAEAILPMDLDYRAPRIRAYDEQGAEASHQDAMDQLDEARDITLLC